MLNLKSSGFLDRERSSSGGREWQQPQIETGSPLRLDFEQKRGKVVLEIFDTEQIYQRLLAEFIDVFLREFESGDNEQGRAFMSRPNLAGLCSNIEQISHLSQQLRGELQKALEDARALDDSIPPALAARRAARTAIGPIFKRFASLLQLYEQYVENHAFARDDIREFLQKPAFQLLWRKCADDARSARYTAMEQQYQEALASTTGATPAITTNLSRLKRQTTADSASSTGSAQPPMSPPNNVASMFTTSLDGYLILPVQRVPRYELLLKELHRLTERIGTDEISIGIESPLLPGGGGGGSLIDGASNTQSRNLQSRLTKLYMDDLADVSTAFKLVSDALIRMNEAIRGTESSQTMRELQERFVGGSVDLVGTGSRTYARRLVREGELMRVTQKSHKHKAFVFHLLSDMILYSERVNDRQLRLHRVISLDGNCKVFSNVPTPSGAQYESYPSERAAANGTGTPHSTGSKRPSLRLSRRSSKDPNSQQQQEEKQQRSPTETSPREGSRRNSVASEGGALHPQNRAFQIATHMKTITMYASTMAEKEGWVKDIKALIRDLAKMQSPHAPPANATLFSAEENSVECKICGTHFSLLKRKHNCKRCGVLTCTDCCNRKRIFGKATPQRCCDVCRLEMDLTARDDQPFRFRIFCQIKSITGLGQLAKGDDRKDPLSRCYFALTQRSTKQRPGMRRGPTSVGHEASFMFPVGPGVEEDDSPYWVLRVYLLSLGEVGTVTFDVRDLMCAREMVFKRKLTVSYPLKGPLVDERYNVHNSSDDSVPTVQLAFELSMPPALWITPDMEAEIQKELVSNKRLYQLVHQGSDLSASDQQGTNTTPDRARAATDSRSSPSLSLHARTRSASTFSRQASSGNGALSDEERRAQSVSSDDEDEAFKFTVEARLRRFEGDDDEENDDDEGGGVNGSSSMSRTSTGGIEFLQREEASQDSVDGVIARTTSNLSARRLKRPSGRLNVSVYAMYERIAKERPSFWTVVCVKYLYIDTALRLANDRSEMKKVSRDALASLQERYLKFDHTPTIRKVWEQVEDEGGGGGAGGDVDHSLGGGHHHQGLARHMTGESVRTSMNVDAQHPQQQQQKGSSVSQQFKNNTPFISQRALMYFDQKIFSPLPPPPVDSSSKALNDSHSVSSKRPFELGATITSTLGSSSKRSPSSLGMNKRSPSSLGLQGQSSGFFATSSKELDLLNHPRSLVLQDLLRTEKAYLAALELLDEVFISPLMQIAHGASATSVKRTIQASRGTGGNSGTQHIPHLLTGSTSSGGASGMMMGSFKQRKEEKESRAVTTAVTQPDVTVLLQSVRQILTINHQLLRDLDSRLSSSIDYSKCIGDIFCRFAVVLKVYNAYATNQPTVEKILTPRDVPFFARRPSAASTMSEQQQGKSSASSSSAAHHHHSSGNKSGTHSSSPSTAGTSTAVSVATEEDDGEGPSESLIAFVKVLEEDERCEGRTFLQLLRLPKERLNRYKRILTALLMHTPDDHNDAELLRSSLKLLEQSEKHISWSLRRRVNLEKLQDIQKSFIKVLPFAKSAPSLVSARRWFKKEGYLVKRCRRDDRLFRFWLFNDALVYGERVSKTANVFRFCRVLMLKDVTVRDLKAADKRVAGENQVLGDHNNAFEIHSPEKSFVVMIPLLLYEKSTTTSSSSMDQIFKNGGGGGDANASSTYGGGTASVNELASEEMKKQLKDEWLREILQCIRDINEDEEVAPDRLGAGAETTDSLFEKTARHHRKIEEKAAPVWAHDDSSNTCSQCPNKFTLTFRRHHCRLCGALVCEACSKARMVLENIHPTKKQRVCKQCVADMNEEEEDGA